MQLRCAGCRCRRSLLRSTIAPDATLGAEVRDVAEILPIINVQCVNAEPLTFIELHPDAFVAALAVPADYSIKRIGEAIFLNLLNDSFLNLGSWEKVHSVPRVLP